MKQLLFSVFLFCSSLSFAQTAAIDSLKELYAISDSSHIRNGLRIQLMKAYDQEGLRELAQATFENGMDLLDDVEDASLKGDLLHEWGIMHVYQKPTEAEAYYHKALSYFEQATDLRGQFLIHSRLVYLYPDLGDEQKAITHYELGKAIIPKLDTREYQLRALPFINNAMAKVHRNNKDFETCLKIYRENLTAFEEVNNQHQIGFTNELIGNTFYSMLQYDSSEYYLLKTLDIKAYSDVLRNRCVTLGNLAQTYFQQKKYDAAIVTYKEAKTIGEKVGRKDLVGFVEMGLSGIYQEKLDFATALVHAEAALKLSQESGRLTVEENAFKKLAQIEKSLQRYDKALDYTEKWMLVKDSLLNLESKTLIEDLKQKHKSEEQQAQIELQDAKLIQQRNVSYGIGAFALLLGGFAFFIFRAAQERKRNNEQLANQNATIAAQNKELQSLDKAKSNFFTNISHELRTPLTLILGPLENAIPQAKNKKQKTDLELAYTNSKRLLSLVGEIMDLSKLESGKLELKTSRIQLTNFVERVFGSYDSLAKVRGIQWKLYNEIPSATWVEADTNKLEKTLNNLLSNAIKHTSKGGSVRLKAQQKNDEIFSFEVQDTGRGITEAERAKIFDRFYQSQDADAPVQGGTGIGLALVQEYTKLMQGKISVESELGKGSCFHLDLPLAIVDASAKIAVSPAKELSKNLQKSYQSRVFDSEKPRLLIVEDNLEMSAYMQRTLEQDYHCTLAHDGQEALKILEKAAFDLITSDVMMPNMDGFAFREQVNRLEGLENTPFVMLTALSQEESRLKGLRLGVDDYISKPFSAPELKARLRNLLHNKEERETWLKSAGTTEEPKPLSQDEQLLKDAEQYILEHLTDSDLSVEKISQVFNYSRRQMTRIIKGLTGLSGLQFIREIRLRRAYELLENRQVQTVAEAAFEVGFEKPSYFSSRFQERFGKRPSNLLA